MHSQYQILLSTAWTRGYGDETNACKRGPVRPSESENREGETLAETLDRPVGGYSLTDFADDAEELDLDVSVEEATDGSVGATPSGSE